MYHYNNSNKKSSLTFILVAAVVDDEDVMLLSLLLLSLFMTVWCTILSFIFNYDRSDSWRVVIEQVLVNMSSSNSSSKFSRLSTRVKGADGQAISYNAERIIGNGSFGVVFQATVVQTGEIVAIKKVLQDKRFKNRELSIMKQLSHTNIVDLKHCFYSQGEKEGEVYLNLVLEYVPDTVYRVARNAQKSNKIIAHFWGPNFE